jgi:hypothetical protein
MPNRLPRGVEFAPDSPLEGDRFEPSLPRKSGIDYPADPAPGRHVRQDSRIGGWGSKVSFTVAGNHGIQAWSVPAVEVEKLPSKIAVL